MLIESRARGREVVLIESYILDGPTVARESMGLNDQQWRVIFDYLVFNHGLLFKVVKNNTEFFVDNYINHGMAHVRDILEVNEEKYDLVWMMIFDFLAISSEGLLQHVMHFRERYTTTMKARGGNFVRKVLGIWNERYDEHWAAVLELLLDGVCEEIFTEQTYEHGLRSFVYLMNGTRVQRVIEKSEKVRRDLI